MTQHTVVGIGELLWDIFPEGPRLGGAPTNFACTAAGLGGSQAKVFMVSSVGRDDLGQRAIESLQKHRVDVSCVSALDSPTGQVFVEFEAEGTPKYKIVENTAWDNLTWSSELMSLAARCDAVCFGTLGQRHKTALKTIRQFVSATPPESLRILDINLRQPFVTDSVILESLTLANVLKLNEEELPMVSSLCGITGSTTQRMSELASRFDLHVVALTCGGDGAWLLCGENLSQQPAIKTTVVDTVGAGDAFTASLALGLLSGHTLDAINSHACQAAGFVCSCAGATPEIPAELQISRS